MTNRQWLAQMSDQDLARFLTNGIKVRFRGTDYSAFYISITQLANRYIPSALGIEEWLSQEQEYELAK